MPAICAVTAAPDLFSVCDEGSWRKRRTHLRFLVAGVSLYNVEFPAMVLDAPFTHVRDGGDELPPPPVELPEGIEAARIFSCPAKETVRPVVLMPRIIRYVSGPSRHFYIELRGSFEEYLERFSSKSRCTLRRKVRKFCAAGGASTPLRVFSQPHEMEEFHRLAVSVSSRTYQHRLLGVGMKDTPEYRRELIDRAAQGRVRGHLLMCGERPAAFSLCHLAGGTFTLGTTGFDPAFARLHPGTVLTYLVLERVFAEGRFHIYDFGTGDFPYKEFFATGYVACADVLYVRRTARNLAVVCAHFALDSANEGLKALLDKLGLKQRIKTFIHHRI